VNFLMMGDDYPHLCRRCRAAVDFAALAYKEEGPDTDDAEAPLLWASDNDMLCGGHKCAAQREVEQEAAPALLYGRVVTHRLHYSQPYPITGANWEGMIDNYRQLARQLGFERIRYDASIVGFYFHKENGDVLVTFPFPDSEL